MATQNDIIKRVLQVLGVIGIGESVSADDGNRVLKIAQSTQEELSMKQEIWWNDLDCVPLEAENAFVDVIAGNCVTTFGLIGEDAARAERNHDRGTETISELNVQMPNGEVVEAEYF